VGYVSLGMHYMFKKLLTTEKWIWYWHDVTKPLILVTIVMIATKLIVTGFIDSNNSKLLVYLIALGLATLAAGWQSNKIKPHMLLRINKLFYKN
jgi:hypothetical protein